MSAPLLSDQRGRRSLPELADETVPGDTLPGRWSSRAFFVFSALIHIVAVVVLSSSFILGTSGRQPSVSAVTPNPQVPIVARMAIDVGPIKFCEMDIEKLAGPSQPRSSH